MAITAPREFVLLPLDILRLCCGAALLPSYVDRRHAAASCRALRAAVDVEQCRHAQTTHVAALLARVVDALGNADETTRAIVGGGVLELHLDPVNRALRTLWFAVVPAASALTDADLVAPLIVRWCAAGGYRSPNVDVYLAWLRRCRMEHANAAAAPSAQVDSYWWLTPHYERCQLYQRRTYDCCVSTREGVRTRAVRCGDGSLRWRIDFERHAGADALCQVLLSLLTGVLAALPPRHHVAALAQLLQHRVGIGQQHGDGARAGVNAKPL